MPALSIELVLSISSAAPSSGSTDCSTIQSTIEETSKWVSVVKWERAKATASATILEQQHRASEALNITIRGASCITTTTLIKDVTSSVNSTLGIKEHGIEGAWHTHTRVATYHSF